MKQCSTQEDSRLSVGQIEEQTLTARQSCQLCPQALPTQSRPVVRRWHPEHLTCALGGKNADMSSGNEALELPEILQGACSPQMVLPCVCWPATHPGGTRESWRCPVPLTEMKPGEVSKASRQRAGVVIEITRDCKENNVRVLVCLLKHKPKAGGFIPRGFTLQHLPGELGDREQRPKQSLVGHAWGGGQQRPLGGVRAGQRWGRESLLASVWTLCSHIALGTSLRSP